MELLYRGFDGLDVGFKGHLPHALSEALDKAKTEAAKIRGPVCLLWNGIGLNVSESGARGGYAYVASTGQFGATWFFKRYSRSDPWGIRLSCNSFFLAVNGLGMARSEIYRTLSVLGVQLQAGSESIGRVDYCADFLISGFTLIPENFVMHSKSSRKDQEGPSEKTIEGRSGKINSVTVGRMPGRQIIVYDKRAEIIAKHKTGWWEIWDAQRLKYGLEPLDRINLDAGSIWRVEIRAGKRHLKDNWAITTWHDLHTRLGDLASDALSAIRYAAPNQDTNRSRWPESVLWRNVREAVEQDLFEMTSCAAPDLVRQVQMEAHRNMLFRQMIGTLVTCAGISGVKGDNLVAFARRTASEMTSDIELRLEDYKAKLARAHIRFADPSSFE